MARQYARRDPEHKEWDVVLRKTTFVTVRVKAQTRQSARVIALEQSMPETAKSRVINMEQGDTTVSYVEEVRRAKV